MTAVACWGATGHALVLRETLAALGHRLVVLADMRELASPIDGVPCVWGEAGFERWEATTNDQGGRGAVVAIGGSRGADRVARQAWFAARGYKVLTLVHPRAFVADDANLDEGCQVLPMAAVCSGAVLGRGVIVNTRASVDHGCELASGVHVAPGATLAGEVRVGENALIGVGATILPRMQIGKGAIVGAGAVVTKNVPAGATVVGVPAATSVRRR